MPNAQMVEYVKQRKAAGAADAEIQNELIKAGWPAPQVMAAFGAPAAVPAPAPVSAPAPVPSYGGAPAPSPFPTTGAGMHDALKQMQSMAGSSASNPRTMKVVQGFALWSAIAAAIRSGADYLGSMFLFGGFYGAYGYASPYSLGSVVSSVIFGAIGGAVGGFIVAMWWVPIYKWVNSISGGKLDTPFKVFFWPGAIIMVLFALPALAMSPIFTIITIGGTLLANYIFAVKANRIILGNIQ